MKLPSFRADIRVPGFLFSGVACGLKEDGRKDVALILCDRPAAVAGAFTTNRLAAPPVLVARRRVRSGRARAVIVNTKSANAGTGAPGLERALACCRIAARLLGVPERQVLPCSTGKIGLPLSMPKMRRGIRLAVAELSAAGFRDAAEAIRTTDAFAKAAIRRIRVNGRVVTIAGLAKGAGMIHPHLATTLAFVLTDAGMAPRQLDRLLQAALPATFNAISVDGDTSTNDTVLLLASGAGATVPSGSAAERRLARAVTEVLGELARMIVADGEGASKLVRIEVRGARSRADAERAARAVANSVLVKTAFTGADPNWGRIACAIGYSGAAVRPEGVAIRIGGVEVARGAVPVGRAADRRARRAMLQREFDVGIDLGLGRQRFGLLTCDLGVDYVRFNSEYTS